MSVLLLGCRFPGIERAVFSFPEIEGLDLGASDGSTLGVKDTTTDGDIVANQRQHVGVLAWLLSDSFALPIVQFGIGPPSRLEIRCRCKSKTESSFVATTPASLQKPLPPVNCVDKVTRLDRELESAAIVGDRNRRGAGRHRGLAEITQRDFRPGDRLLLLIDDRAGERVRDVRLGFGFGLGRRLSTEY